MKGIEKEEGHYINWYKQAYEKVYVGVNNPDLIIHTKKEIKKAISLTRPRPSSWTRANSGMNDDSNVSQIQKTSQKRPATSRNTLWMVSTGSWPPTSPSARTGYDLVLSERHLNDGTELGNWIRLNKKIIESAGAKIRYDFMQTSWKKLSRTNLLSKVKSN